MTEVTTNKPDDTVADKLRPDPTDGPWYATNEHDGPASWRVYSSAPGYPNDGWVIAGDIMGPDAEANAKLLAASRNLLDAAGSALAAMDACKYPAIVRALAIAVSQAEGLA